MNIELVKINQAINKGITELNGFIAKHIVSDETKKTTDTESGLCFTIDSANNLHEYNKLTQKIRDKQKEFREENEKISVIYNRINAIKKIKKRYEK